MRDGNSMIPTDREYDAHFATRCERCDCVVSNDEHEENSRGEWFCLDCWENHEREADEERIAEMEDAS